MEKDNIIEFDEARRKDDWECAVEELGRQAFEAQAGIYITDKKSFKTFDIMTAYMEQFAAACGGEFFVDGDTLRPDASACIILQSLDVKGNELELLSKIIALTDDFDICMDADGALKITVSIRNALIKV